MVDAKYIFKELEASKQVAKQPNNKKTLTNIINVFSSIFLEKNKKEITQNKGVFTPAMQRRFDTELRSYIKKSTIKDVLIKEPIADVSFTKNNGVYVKRTIKPVVFTVKDKSYLDSSSEKLLDLVKNGKDNLAFDAIDNMVFSMVEKSSTTNYLLFKKKTLFRYSEGAQYKTKKVTLGNVSLNDLNIKDDLKIAYLAAKKILNDSGKDEALSFLTKKVNSTYSNIDREVSTKTAQSTGFNGWMWGASSSDNPSIAHMALYGKTAKIGEPINGEFPGERPNCSCQMIFCMV